MPVYLGSLGRMVKLPYVGSQQVQTEERYNFSSTLEGKRKAQVKPKGPRTWALSADHFRPNEHSLLSQFADGAWGNGPFVFVSADAPHTNLLTPEVSMLLSGSFIPSNTASIANGGPMRAGGIVFARSIVNIGGFPSSTERTPILEGRVVTASVYAEGLGGRLRLVWVDSSGATISYYQSDPNASGLAERISVSGVPPEGAVGCFIFLTSSVTRFAGPAITWTPEVMTWSVGLGCARAVVHGVSSDVRLAVPGATYSNIAFSVSEVG